MGNQCCNQTSSKTATENLNIASSITADQKKQMEEADVFNENTLVQSVNVFTSHETLMTKSGNSIKRPTKFASDDTQIKSNPQLLSTELQSGTQLRPEDAKALDPLVPINPSRSIRDRTRKSIILDPSRFRLERKSSVEDHYEFLNCLGKGSFAEVRMVRNKDTAAKRALKVISKATCQTSENYLEEIEILKQLDHPNVLRLYEFYQDENNYYLITEVCEGGDLLTTITSLRKLKQADVAQIMRQVLAAVKYCHNKRVVHRDIKPENILFSEPRLDSTVKVIDFGRSKILKERGGKLTDFAGSLFYMAPEVVSNQEYNESCDIWSCGVIMHLLLSGRPPFCERTKDGTINAIKKGMVNFSTPLWFTIDKEAKDLLKCMLKKDPKERITANEALKHPWFTKHAKALWSKQEQDENLIQSLRNLKNFEAETTLQKAVLSYIASQEIEPCTEKKLKQVFDVLDTDENGHVSCKELVEGYSKIYKDKTKAQRACLQVLKKTDFNKNGCIDYNEFLMVSMEKSKTITEKTLRRAFDFYDENKNGVITLDELRRVFGSFCTEKEIENMMKEVDMNGDGRITFSEFKEVMAKFKKVHSKIKCFWSL